MIDDAFLMSITMPMLLLPLTIIALAIYYILTCACATVVHPGSKVSSPNTRPNKKEKS